MVLVIPRSNWILDCVSTSDFIRYAYIDYDISIESIGFIVTLNLGLTAMF